MKRFAALSKRAWIIAVVGVCVISGAMGATSGGMTSGAAESADALYTKALGLYRSRDYAGAVKILRAIVAEHPEHNEAQQLLVMLEEAQHSGESVYGALRQLTATLEENDRDRDRLRQLLAGAESRLGNMTKEISESAGQLAATHEQLNKTQDALKASQQELQRAQGELTDLRASKDAQVAEAQRTSASLAIDKDRLAQDLAAARATLAERESDLARTQEVNGGMARQFAQVQKERADFAKALEKLRQEYAGQDARLTASVASGQESAKAKARLDAQLGEAKDAGERLSKERDALKASLTMTEAQRNETLAKLAVSQESLVASTKELAELHKTNADLTRGLSDARESITSAKSSIDTLQVKRSDYEKLQRSFNQSQEQLVKVTAERDAQNKQLAILQEEMRSAQQQRQQQAASISQKDQEIGRLNRALNTAEASLKSTETELEGSKEQHQEELAKLAEQLKTTEDSTGSHQQEAAELQAAQGKLKQRVADLENQLGKSQTAERNLATEVELVRERNRELESQHQVDSGVRESERNAKLAALVGQREQDLLNLKSSLTQSDELLARERRERERDRREYELAQNTAKDALDLKGKQTEDRVAKETDDLRLTSARTEGRLTAIEEERDSFAKRLTQAEQEKLELQAKLLAVMKRADASSVHAEAERPSDGGQGDQARAQLTEQLQAQEQFNAQLKEQLAKRESQLETLQRSSSGAPRDATPSLPQATPPTTLVSPPVAPPARETSAPRGDDSVEIIGVSQDLGFVILKGVDKTNEGKRLALQKERQTPIEVEVTEIDNAGLAVAYIQGEVPDPLPLRRGDLVAARRSAAR